jgi:hypothetical protein
MGYQNLYYLAEGRHEWLKKLLAHVKNETATQPLAVAEVE